MPLPVITSATSSCVYEMCEQSGHAVCKTFAAYYERLCAGAQAVVSDPSPANLSTLQALLRESEGLHYDR